MAHISTSHVTHMNESWHTYQRVITHIPAHHWPGCQQFSLLRPVHNSQKSEVISTAYLYMSFFPKEPDNWWLFCEKRPGTGCQQFALLRPDHNSQKSKGISLAIYYYLPLSDALSLHVIFRKRAL